MSAGSGIDLSDEVMKKFNEMQKNKSLRCVIMKITDSNDQVVVEKTVERQQGRSDEEDFNSIVSELQDSEPRYLLIDMKAPPAKEGAQENDKMILLTWNPDTASIKKKMIYSSTKQVIHTKLKGVAKEIQTSDRGDLDFKSIRGMMKGL